MRAREKGKEASASGRIPNAGILSARIRYHPRIIVIIIRMVSFGRSQRDDAGLRGAAIRAPPSIPPPPPSARRTNPPSPFIRSADCKLIVVARYAVIRARLLVLHARASVCKADAADFDDPAAPAASTRIVAY